MQTGIPYMATRRVLLVENVPHLMHTRLWGSQRDSVLKPTYTHNHLGGIKTDGSCPRCNSYAEALAADMDQYESDIEIDWHENTESTMQIMKTPKQDWYPES